MRLEMMIGVTGVLMNNEAAKGAKVVAVCNFQNEGEGRWTQTIDDGKYAVQPGRVGKRDCEFKTTFDEFDKVAGKLANPMLMMLMGEVRVSGMRKMGRSRNCSRCNGARQPAGLRLIASCSRSWTGVQVRGLSRAP